MPEDEPSAYEAGATRRWLKVEQKRWTIGPMDSTNQRGAVSNRLLLDLDAFFLEHRLCGDLDGDATGERAWLACIACGAWIEWLVETPQPS